MRAAAAPLHGVTPQRITLLLLAVAALAFVATLAGGFLGDDFVYISRFRVFAWENWPRLFTREWSEGIWGMPLHELRPFAALSFMVDARLYSGAALGYRLTNLLLHLACVALVMQLAWRYSGENRTAAIVSGLLFAFQPAHAEAVSWITGRVDLLSTAGALGFWFFAESWCDSGRPRHCALALGLFFMGIFAKELCLIAPPLLCVRWAWVEPRVSRSTWWRRARLIAGTAAIYIIYILCRRAAFGSDSGGNSGAWRDAAAWDRQASYLGWIFPVLPFASTAEFPHVLSLGALRAAWITVSVLAVIAMTLAVARNQARWGNIIFFTATWYFATVGSLLVVGYFSPRHLYFPTAGLAIGAGLALVGIFRAPTMRFALATAAIGWCAAGHVAALIPWVENGLTSRRLIAALDEDLDGQPLDTLACIAVPEIAHTTWLWSWSSPQAINIPFLSAPHLASEVIERTGNYFRPDDWAHDRHAVAAVEAASRAVLLAADAHGKIQHSRVSRAELQAHLPALVAAEKNGLTTDAWTAWVNGFFKP